jgi:hypothetical protein
MGIYDRQAATALRLIKKAGGVLTVSREAPSTGAIDPVTRRAMPAQVITRDFPCVALPPGKQQSLVPQSLREKLEIEFHIAQKGNQDFIPMETDYAVWGGTRYRIVWTTTYDPAADGAIYTLAYGAK